MDVKLFIISLFLLAMGGILISNRFNRACNWNKYNPILSKEQSNSNYNFVIRQTNNFVRIQTIGMRTVGIISILLGIWWIIQSF